MELDLTSGMGNLGYLTNQSQGIAIWSIVSIVLALVGGIVVYILFLKPNKKVDNKFLAWLKEFLNFKTFVIEDVLKITYVILAIFITLSSFGLIGVSFVSFLTTLIFGNIVLRIAYEASMILIMIWKNTKEINGKLKK